MLIKSGSHRSKARNRDEDFADQLGRASLSGMMTFTII